MYSNPILQNQRSSANQQMNPQLAQLRQAVQMYKNSPNANAAIQNMLHQDPNYNAAMQLIHTAGGNSQQVFYALAQQMGVAPQEVFNSLGI